MRFKNVLLTMMFVSLSMRTASAQPAVNSSKVQQAAFQPITNHQSPVTSSPLPVLQQGHSKRIWSLAFAPDKSLLATASEDGTARLWDMASGQLKLNLTHGAAVTRVAFAANGHTLLTQSGNQLRFWDAQNGQMLGQAPVSPSNMAMFAVNGDVVTIYTPQNQIQTWNARTGQVASTRPWKPETYQKYGRPLAFLPDGKTLLFQREEQEEIDQTNNGANAARRYKLITFQLLDADTGDSRLTLQSFELRSDQGYNQDIAFAPDGSAFALANNDSGARVWNLKTGKMLPVLKGNASPVTALAFSPDGKKLATGSNRGSKEVPSDVYLWDVATGKKLMVLPGKPDVSVRALGFDRTGQTLAVVAPNWHENQKGITLWDVATGKPRVMTAGGGDSDTLQIAPDNALLVGSDNDGALRAWNTKTGQEAAAFIPASGLYYPTYSPDGKLAAAVAYNGYLQVWDTTTGKLRDNFETDEQFGPHDRYLQTEPVFAPDGKSIAYVVPHNGGVDVYDLQTRQKQRVYTPNINGTTTAKRLVFSPDGKMLAVSGDKTSLVDTANGKLLGTLDCQFNNTNMDRERIARFTPDNKTFVVLNNNAVQLYDVPGGKLRAPITSARPQDGIHLSADGSLVAVMLDREIQLYDVATGALKANLKITDGEFLYDIALSPDAHWILTRGVQKIRVWNVATGQIAGILSGAVPGSDAGQEYSFLPSGLAFSNDSSRVCIRTASNQVLAWDIVAGKRVAFTSMEQLANLPPMFQRPLSVSGASLVINDPRTGTPLATLTAFAALTPEEQKAGAKAPDDKVLAMRPFEWLAQTPNGFYDGSANIATYLLWNVNGVLQPGDKYTAQFHHPDQLQKALKLELPPVTPTIQDKPVAVNARIR